MSLTTDAIFFIKDGAVVKEMMMTEFEALLEGVFEIPEFKGQKLYAVYLQINDQLHIKSLVFFLVGFTSNGNIVPEWNIPLNQLLQSAGRGPDLGGGVTRLVCKSQCAVPWHQDSLWDPLPQTLQILVQTVNRNRLGIIINDDFLGVSDWNDLPTAPPVIAPPTLIPVAIPTVAPTLIPTMIPTLTANAPPTIAPTLVPPVIAPPILKPQGGVPVLTPVPILNIPDLVNPSAQAEKNKADLEAYTTLKKEFDAMRAAHSVRIDKLQKERDELKDKSKSIADSIKEQAKEQILAAKNELQNEIEKKEQQIKAMKAQIEHEQKRYAELKEQQVLQAARYQAERESMMDQLKQDVESDKIEGLKEAFKKELNARVDAETSKVNETLAIREVEIFYREEQLKIFRDEVAQLKTEKQSLLKENGSHILEALEQNGVTLVAYNVGVGHTTLSLDDVGRYLDERVEYLADRCGVAPDIFSAWQEHYNKPACHFMSEDGEVCNKPIKRTDLAVQFEHGLSDRCENHKQNAS